jgi:acetyltransferase-like isoleucine patch superfamily enzyme
MVNGKTQQLAMNSPSVIINKTIPYGITDLYIANDVTDLWKPGNYHTGTVKARGTVTLTAGTYNFKELIFEPNTKIILDTTNGMININVADHLSFGDNFTIVNNNSSGINFYTNVTDTVTIGTNSNFVGSLMAPNSKIVINSRTNIIGNLLGDSIQIEPDVTINSQ